MFLSRNEPRSMTRSAVLALAALLLLTGGAFTPVSAQTPDAPADATEEAARREEAYRLLGVRLQQADRDAGAGRTADAAKRYEEAYSLATRVGTKAEFVRATRDQWSRARRDRIEIEPG